jgi:hypothetical protein
MIHVASGLQNFRAVMQQQFPLRCDLKPLSASFFPRKVSPVANATGPAISCVRGGASIPTEFEASKPFQK